MADPARSHEDPFHRLPQTAPRASAATAPFVGNDTIDDNLAESVQVALWTALGDSIAGVRIGVRAGEVRLSGTLSDETLRAAAEAAVRAVPGVIGVNNDVVTLSAANAEGEDTTAGAVVEQMLYVTRFCGLDGASIKAAVQEGQKTLDRFIADRGIAGGDDLILIYRNRRNQTITLQVGYPVTAAAAGRADGDVRSGTVPNTALRTVNPPPGIPALLDMHDDLLAQAKAEGWETSPWFWQRFAGGARRPWSGEEVATLSLACQP